MQTELQAIRDVVTGASLPAKIQATILTRFDELPMLYAELNRTYETRVSDHIANSVASMIRILSAQEAGPSAPQLAATMLEHMGAMHSRYGISVVLKPPPVATAGRRSTST